MKVYSKSDDELVDHLRKWHKSSKEKHKDWRAEARECYDLYAGRQWSDDEEADMEEDLRQAVTFNRIGSLVDAVSGHQINNRQEARYLPRQLGDVQISEVLTGAGQWVDDEAATEDEEEDLFQDLLITGMGWSECRMSYDEDIDGKVIPGERFSPLEAGWDPMASRRNISDSKFRYRGRWMGRDEAEERWPKIKEHDFTGDDEWADEMGDSPHNAQRAHLYENDQSEWYKKDRDEVYIVHMEWWEHEAVHRIGDPQGRILELSDSKYQKLSTYIKDNDIPHIRQVRKKYYRAFVGGPMMLEKSVNPWPDGFNLMCCTGKRDSQKKTWFGIVRALKDPQKWSNKFLSDLQDMVVSTRQGGAMIEQSALIDPRNAEDNWNSYGLLILQDGAISNGRVKETMPPPLPPALDRMIEWCISAIPSVSGINQEFMGYADRDQPNVLELQRKKSAINVLATLFSSLRKYRKDRAKAVLHYIREYMDDGRLIRVLGGDGLEQYIPLALDKEVEDYDIIIDEASSSPNQKEETLSVMMMLLPYLVQAGISPPVEVLDYLPLPSSFISKWKEQMQPSPPSEEEQKAKQIQEKAVVTDIRKDEADGTYKAAQARKAEADAEAQELQNRAVSMGLMDVEEL